MPEEGLESVVSGIIVLVFVIILGYVFFQVFISLPGGTFWAGLFVVFIIAIAAGLVSRIARGSGDGL